MGKSKGSDIKLKLLLWKKRNWEGRESQVAQLKMGTSKQGAGVLLCRIMVLPRESSFLTVMDGQWDVSWSHEVELVGSSLKKSRGWLGLPQGLNSKESACKAGDLQETQVWPLDREDALELEVATHLVFLPGKSHRQRRLAGCSPWNHRELDMTV